MSKRSSRLLSFALLASIAAAGYPASSALGRQLSQESLPVLIPRALLFEVAEMRSPALSPDGVYLAYLAPAPVADRRVLQVWVRTLGRADDRALTQDPQSVDFYRWTHNGKLVYGRDTDGDENYQLYLVDPQTRARSELTPYAGVQARLNDASPGVPDELLVELNLQDPRKHDLYRLNLRTGRLALDTENPGSVTSWVADYQLRVRAANAATPDGGREVLVRETPDQPWTVLRRWGPEDEGRAVRFSNDGGTLYLGANHGANAMRLLAVDLATGVESVLAEDPEYDVRGVLFDPTSTPQAVSFYKDRLAWQVLDERVAADFEALAAAHRGELQNIDGDLADRTWLVTYGVDVEPLSFYIYDRPSKTATLLFSTQPRLAGLPLAPMEPISYTARDGLTIHGYLTTPVGIRPERLPAVLFVHGGPWTRDTWGYNPEVQLLANRGYVVLQVNFRGSAGYGRAFLQAGDREWAGKMHDDLIDGVDWLVNNGIAGQRRIAIVGGSYGGYAALVGLTFTPNVFAAAVDRLGPSNLVTLRRSDPAYWGPTQAIRNRRIGDPDSEEEFLQSRSPLFFVDRIRAPLLIGQGANDVRVPQAESDQMVQAMRAANKAVQYIVYGGEGHGFSNGSNNLHFWGLVEAFLARELGGRFEPVDERQLAGHTGEFR